MQEHTSLGYLLNKAGRLAKWDITARMTTLGLTFPQWIVLKDISYYEHGDSSELTLAAIARRLDSNRPNVMGLIDRLEKLGLVERAVNPKNRRAHIISLTDKARDVMSQLQDMSRQTTGKAFQGFTQTEQAAALDYLARIIANLAI